MSSDFRASHPVPVSTIEAWRDEADVVVVGYGGAGVCAAIEATRAGADTLVLERASGGGGTTAMSGGYLYLGGGTRVQKACGFEDSADNLLRYLNASADVPDPEKFRLYAERSVEHFDWLVAQGVPFKDSVWEDRTNMTQTDDCLLWSGNEKAYPYNELAKPVPRGHKVAAEGGRRAVAVRQARRSGARSRGAYRVRLSSPHPRRRRCGRGMRARHAAGR